MRNASLEDQARSDATKAANAAHAGKTDADRAADTRAANAAHAGKSDRDRAADTRAANAGSDIVKSHSSNSPAVASTPSSGNPSTKGGPSWTQISTVIAGDDFYGCTRVFKAPPAGQSFAVVTPVSDWSDGKSSSGSAAAAVTHAFKLSDATSGGATKVKIQFGMVNGITPGGMGDPSETSLTLSVGSSGYVVLAVSTGLSGVATSASISISSSIPSDSSSSGHIALGYATKNTGPTSVTCSQSVSGSLWHQQCGATTHLFGSV